MTTGTLVGQIPVGATILYHGTRYKLVRRYRSAAPKVVIEVKNLDTGGHSMGSLPDTDRLRVVT